MSDSWNPSREEVIDGLKKVWDAFDHMEHELYADYVFDALKMLKEQEPKVLTLEEVEQIMTVWGELNGHGFETMPLLLDRIEGSKVRFVSRDVGWYLEADKKDYAKSWRCWSAKPIDEQREATPWDE